MNVTMILIDAQDASGGAVPVRLASHDVPECCHLGGEQWEPALSVLPDFALDFFGGAFAGQVTAPRTGFAVATTGLAGFGTSAATRARFADARVRIWVGDITSTATVDLGPLTLRFDGRLTGEPSIDDDTRTARFDAAVQDSWADKPLLALFAGTGGIEGPADLTGQVKPLVLGNARFCGGVLIDNVDNVWMVSNGAVQAVNAVYDRLASLGASAGNFADLAALKAASIPNGSWATCLAQGLVRLGAPPDGRVSFDVAGSNSGTGGYVRKPGAIIRRIADLAGGTVDAASLAALDTARPYNLALQLREQATPRDAIAQIADSVAAVAGVSLTGKLFAQALGIGTPSETLAPDGSSAVAVASVEELPKAAPNWRLATEAELTFEVHSVDEAAFEYRWQGEYSASRVYRIDDVVTGPDGAAWAYINATPAAGQALPVFPATSNPYWQVFQRPGSAAVAPANANRVPFSRMEGDQGWKIAFNPSGMATSPAYGEFNGFRFYRANPTATVPDQFLVISQATGPASAFRVQPGERLSVQARIDAFGPVGSWYLAIQFVRADGSTTFQAVASGTGQSFLSAIRSGFVDVPTGGSPVVGGYLEIGMSSNAAGGIVFAISEPMVTSAASGQTVHPAFSPGPNAVDGATRNTGALNADGLEAIDAGGPLFVGQLPGLRVEYAGGETVEDLKPREAGADVTATAQRTIEPDFPVIEIKQGEAGHTGTRTVNHVAKRGGVVLTGGTWSRPALNLTGATVTVNSSTGAASISNVTQSGSYTIRYTHTDGIATDLAVNVTYFAASGAANSASSIVRSFSSLAFVAVSNEMTIQIPAGQTTAELAANAIALRVTGFPAGDTQTEFRWTRESSPGTWSAVGSVQGSSPHPRTDNVSGLAVPTNGSVTCNRTATGLTAGSVQKFRLEARVSGGNTGKTVSIVSPNNMCSVAA